jgi:hypothetical protein
VQSLIELRQRPQDFCGGCGSDASGNASGAHLLIGVHGGYHFEAADIDSTDAAGQNVSVLVPFDMPVAGDCEFRCASSKLNFKVIGNN